MDEAEQAVRHYLELLPEDGDGYGSARKGRPADPVARLLERADAERSFIEMGKTWADRHRISATAFLHEGVPASVLQQAGFKVPVKDGQEGIRPETQDDDMRALMPAHHPFTVDGLMVRANSSRRAAQKAMDKAVEEGFLEAVGVSVVQESARGTVLYRRRYS